MKYVDMGVTEDIIKVHDDGVVMWRMKDVGHRL